MNFIEASSLSTIDCQLTDNRLDLSPAQYEITRQAIYRTGDYEYYSCLQFVNNPIEQGLKALRSRVSVVVDVPEIQVSIVPKLQQTFKNPVYCCATNNVAVDGRKSRAAVGLENLATTHSESVYVMGQDRDSLDCLIELTKNQTINPSLVVLTVPSLLNLSAEQYFKYASIPAIYIDSAKGGATVAVAIVNTLINLSWHTSKNLSVLH